MVPAILQDNSTMAFSGDDGCDDGWVNAVSLSYFFDEDTVRLDGFQVHLGKHFGTVDPCVKRKETISSTSEKDGFSEFTNSASASDHTHSLGRSF